VPTHVFKVLLNSGASVEKAHINAPIQPKIVHPKNMFRINIQEICSLFPV
jgi:hypothetical protein